MAQPLRTICAENRIMTRAFVPAVTTLLVRWPITFGSANSNSLQTVHGGFYANDSTVTLNSPNNFTIVSESIEYNGISAPITYAASRTKTITPTDFDVKSDPLLPSAFNQSVYAYGTVAWYKAEISVPNTSSSFMYSDRKLITHKALSQTLYLDKANTTIVNGVDTVGQFTTTGTTPTQAGGVGYCPFFVGTYVSGEPMTIVMCGDSITEGAGDTSFCPVGTGIGQRISYGDGSRIISVMNIARSGSFGSNAALSPSNKFLDLAKYCIYAHEFYGANDLGTNGLNNNLATLLATCRTNWAALRSKGISKIIRGRLLTRTTAGSGLTEAGQTIGGAGWDVGGTALTFNATTLPGEIALGNIDRIVDYSDARGIDITKWPVNAISNYATADGTHPTTPITTLMALEERAIFDSIGDGFLIPDVGYVPFNTAITYSNNSSPILLSIADARMWSYVSTVSTAAVSNKGFFQNGYNIGLRTGDYFLYTRIGSTPAVSKHIVVDVDSNGAATLSSPL